MKTRDWVFFILLSLVWGSSFFWIKIGLEEIGPVTLVALRLLWGVIGLGAAIAIIRPAFPTDGRTWLRLAVIGLTNTAIPFLLITWGELFIDSGVASVLNSGVPLFTLMIAHFFLVDEHITLDKVVGLVVGFVGILLLLSRDLGEVSFRANILGQLAVLVAAGLYAGSSVYIRRHLREVSPAVQALITITAADLVMWVMVGLTERPYHLPQLPLTWVAVAWLGLLGTCIAYLMYYRLIQTIGATRTTMVTYVVPVIGVLLGVVFLNEHLDWQLAVGAGLTLVGVWFVNSNFSFRTRVEVAADESRAR